MENKYFRPKLLQPTLFLPHKTVILLRPHARLTTNSGSIKSSRWGTLISRTVTLYHDRTRAINRCNFNHVIESHFHCISQARFITERGCSRSCRYKLQSTSTSTARQPVPVLSNAIGRNDCLYFARWLSRLSPAHNNLNYCPR